MPTTRAGLVLAVLSCVLHSATVCFGAPEAFEVGVERAGELPRGKEADGIVGDFVLRNDLVEAVVSGNLPRRRANMSTFYGADGVTPGCLYDLTLRGANNDQLTIFSPSGQQGTVSYVRVVDDGAKGEAVIETVVTAASKRGIYKRHEYRLRDGWQGVLIVTTLRNEAAEPLRVTPPDKWTNFARYSEVEGGDIRWADAVDPADKAGYAFAWVERDGMKSPPAELNLQPGQELTFARFVAVGRSPAEAAGLVASFRGDAGSVAGSIKQDDGSPVTTATILLKTDRKPLPAYPDQKGEFSFALRPGSYEFELTDIGRETQPVKVDVKAGETARLELTMKPASAIEFDVKDAAGKSIPCKAQFIGINGTPSPDLGPPNRAHGCRDQYHSEKGAFRVQVPPGNYRVIVTRGIEYAHLAQELVVKPRETQKVAGTLARIIDTTGWVSADFHNHSTPSGDNTCGTPDRVINLAAEHIEFAPTTEHNRLFDWRPTIEALKLSQELNTVPGMELTGPGEHLNAFPFKPDPTIQDGGAPEWTNDPRINALVLREFQGVEPDRWVHLNHPTIVADFFDRNRDGKPDGGYLHLGRLLDGLETQNFGGDDILTTVPYHLYKQGDKEQVAPVTEFVWLQMLNRGDHVWGIAVSDAHSVHGNGVGGWRTYVKSPTDAPAEIDWRDITRRARAGQMVLTNGPYLEVATADGAIAGGVTRASGTSIDLKVRVQCTDWIDIDRVQVLVNGVARPDLNFTRQSHPDWFAKVPEVVRFDRTIPVPITEDSHLIVVAYGGSSTLATGYGSSDQAAMHPCAYNNPIFVDLDGHGFKPNGDMLGFPPGAKPSVEDVKRMLAK